LIASSFYPSIQRAAQVAGEVVSAIQVGVSLFRAGVSVITGTGEVFRTPEWNPGTNSFAPQNSATLRPKLSYSKCFNSYRFSSNFTGRARTVAEIVELGSELSLLGDLAATGYKTSARSAYIGGTKNRYASGLNYVFRRAADAVGSPTLKGRLTSIGSRVTPALAVTGAFTGGYNLSVAIQCATGVLN